MRKSILNLLVIILLIFISKSCDKTENPVDDKITAADINSVKAAVMNGDWMISYYFDSDKEETADYAGYTFNFNADGTLGATNGNSSLSGAWSVTSSDNGNDEDSSDDVDFNILFSSPEIFVELSDDWDIKKYAATKIELVDVSGGDGSTDLLTFEKK
ncbi:MAG: hypothetical protein ACR2MT_13660 [Aurantibacter sp.]